MILQEKPQQRQPQQQQLSRIQISRKSLTRPLRPQHRPQTPLAFTNTVTTTTKNRTMAISLTFLLSSHPRTP